MDKAADTWVITADGTEARFFRERTRMGALQEIEGCRMAATDEERAAGRHHRGDKRAPQHEPERRFLNRVASRIVLGATRYEFENLVLMGPPRALGMLKMALPTEVAARIETTDAHERRQDDPAALRHHLSEARARER